MHLLYNSLNRLRERMGMLSLASFMYPLKGYGVVLLMRIVAPFIFIGGTLFVTACASTSGSSSSSDDLLLYSGASPTKEHPLQSAPEMSYEDFYSQNWDTYILENGFVGDSLIPRKKLHPTASFVSMARTYAPELFEVVYYPSAEDMLEEPRDIWQKVRAGQEMLPPRNNAHYERILKRYESNQVFFDNLQKNSEPYLYYIITQLEQRNMPIDLAILVAVESDFDPYALSHAGAAGLWQITAPTADALYMPHNFWFDGRRDILLSTEKALDYLEQLYARFGDWELAVAAYNSGPTRVANAIRKQEKKGGATDFWSLNLPAETEDYVPKLLAMNEVIGNPTAHDVELKPQINMPYFHIVRYRDQISFAQLASATDMSVESLMHLNAGYSQGFSAPYQNGYILLPHKAYDDAIDFLEADARSTDPVWQVYLASATETADGVAGSFDTTARDLLKMNMREQLYSETARLLIVPMEEAEAKRYASVLEANIERFLPPSSLRREIYTVRSGDTLWSIAQQHNVTTGQLTAWNGLEAKDILAINKRIYVEPEFDVPSGISAHLKLVDAAEHEVFRKVNYPVRSNNPLSWYEAARRLGVPVQLLKEWNPGLDWRGKSLVRFNVDTTAVRY